MKRIGVLAALMFGMVSAAGAQSFCVLYAFSGGADGDQPYGGLVMGSSGILYGTTVGGGQGGGVVFSVKKSTCKQGANTVLHRFGSKDGDGLAPFDTLRVDPTGKYLYGTTLNGGSANAGTVFRLTIQGNKEEIINVSENWGLANPYAGLTGTDTDLYGVAYNSGTKNMGGVFGPNGRVLHNFGSITNDGANPYGGVVVSKGRIYGTTRYGGGGNPGNGTVYSVNTNGSGYKVLHRFSGPSDGTQPYSKLLVDESTGNIYGTTIMGGKYNQGTIFEMSPAGKILRQYNFGAQANDGEEPAGNLVMDAQHNIFGTTIYGSANGNGVIYKLDSSFQMTVLHAFGVLDGGHPEGGLMMDSSGDLYGTAPNLGLYGSGTVFRFVR
jgi:uncharacterized repeat protein (TIGR03803 family)